jgi:hypothetical protein
MVRNRDRTFGRQISWQYNSLPGRLAPHAPRTNGRMRPSSTR